ncbi:MAG: SHD1 domain-containing protein [Thermoguttaceae bacterium]
MSSVSSVFRFVSLITLLHCGIVFSQERTWTDKTGKFEVVATLVEYDGKNVKIKKQDGKSLTLPVDKLSDEDVQFLKEWKSDANPFAGEDEENIFAGGEVEPKTNSSKNSPPKKTTSTPPNKTPENAVETIPFPHEINIDQVSSIMLRFRDNDWSVEADPIPVQFSKRPRMVNFPFSVNRFGESLYTFPVYFSQNPPTKVLTTVQRGELLGSRDTAIFVGDLTTGRAVSIQKPKELFVPLDISPSGNRIVVRQDEGTRSSDTLDKAVFFDVTSDGKLVQIGECFPFAKMAGKSIMKDEKNIFAAYWIDDEHVLFLSRRMCLLMINVATGQPCWKYEGSGLAMKSLVFSPGKKYFLLSTKEGTVLIEAVSGDVVGVFPEMSSPDGATFSPDGKQICQWRMDSLRFWDATNGKLQESSMTVIGSGSPIWVTNRYLLAEDFLIDLQEKMPVWKYTRLFHADFTLFGEILWKIESEKSGASLVDAVIPPKALIDGSKGSTSTEYLLSPGSSVSLKLDSSIVENRAEIEKVIREKCEKNQWKIASDTPYQIVLKIVSGEEQKIQYRSVMGGFGGESSEVTVRTQTARIDIEKEGKSIWANTTTYGPPPILTNRDKSKSFQDTINEYTKPKISWFSGITIPNNIVDTAKLGQSQLFGK